MMPSPSTSTATTPICAVIAGAGSFPIEVAREAKRLGRTVLGIGLQHWVDPAFSTQVDCYEEVSVGQLGRLLERLAAHHVQQAIMAGKVTKEILFDPRVQFDADALGIISHVKEFSVNALLGAIGQWMGQRGVELLDSSTFLQGNLCPVGPMTQRGPTAAEREDIRVGVQVARAIAALDIGQTVVVKRRVIVAVEALEGTDATIRRAGQVAGAECVVVKMASPKQDMRFDVPILGLQTIETLAAVGATCMAVEAHTALLLNRAELLRQANRAGLCLVGVDPSTIS